MNQDDLAKVTAEELTKLFENGRAKLTRSVGNYHVLSIDNETVGGMFQNSYEGPYVIKVGERIVGFTTDR
ncbi:MAG: hypothetical protein AAB535_02550 [Patescibacteria group bacterium]